MPGTMSRRVVEHRLVRVEGQIGEQDHAAVAEVVAEALRQGDGDARRTCAPSPADHRHRRGLARPEPGCGGLSLAGHDVTPANLPRVGRQYVEKVLTLEDGVDDGAGAERGPIPRHPEVVDHEHGAAGAPSEVDEVAIERRQPAVHEQSREGPPTRQVGAQLHRRHDLDELDGDRGRMAPGGHRPEPGRPRVSQPQHDEPGLRHQPSDLAGASRADGAS